MKSVNHHSPRKPEGRSLPVLLVQKQLVFSHHVIYFHVFAGVGVGVFTFFFIVFPS